MNETMADENNARDASNANADKSAKPNAAPEQSGAAFVHPEHPPMISVMPHHEEKAAEPLTVPPRPPVSNLMPPTPETKIELTVSPPPTFGQMADNIKLPETPVMQAPVSPPPQPPKASPPAQDAIEAEVGLVLPTPRGAVPVRDDVANALKGIRLPEKRAYTPEGEKKFAPSPAQTQASQQSQSLDAILSARITENEPATPTPAPQPAPTIVPQQDVFHEDMEIQSVHTLKQDLQQVVREQKMSVVKAVALEQEKKSRVERIETPPKPPSRAPAVIFVAVLLFLLGLGALGGVYYVATIQSAPGPKVQDNSIVFAEQTKQFPLNDESPEAIKTQLAQERLGGGTLGSLEHIVPKVAGTDASGAQVVRDATLSEFFKAIGANPPDNLMRALGDKFFFGIHTVDKNAPILVLQVTAYDRAFDGMLAWEKDMNADLSPIFTPVPHLMLGADGIQTQRTFTDLVMRNYDVRALKDDDGVIELYYSFPTRDLLVIAESPYTFTEILSRLQAGRRL